MPKGEWRKPTLPTPGSSGPFFRIPHSPFRIPMTIKTFRARSLRDALAMVRAEFGPQAAVLHAREVNAGPIAKLLRGRSVEVAATPDPSPLADRAAASGALDGVAGWAARTQRAASDPAGHEAATRPAPAGAADPALRLLADLLAADVEPELARSLAREAVPADASSDPPRWREAAIDALAERLSVTGPSPAARGESRVVALVGATGVGKTTTVAKLAAGFRLQQNLRVGLVTVDTYRTAAVEQLRTYAQIIDLPMEVVSTPAEMRAAKDRLARLDLVLIDTDGRSPRDTLRVAELRDLLAAAQPAETHLVASIAASPSAIRDAVARFAAVAPTALLLTKLDEASTAGHAAAPVVESGLPISYLTDGQSVPEDIRVAQRRALAASFLDPGAA